MKLSLETRDPVEVHADALIVGRHSDAAKLTPALMAVDGKLGGLLSKVLAAEKFEGKPGQVSHLHTDGRLRAARVLVAGLGPRKGSAADAVRSAASAAARRARDLGARSAAVYLAADGLSARARAQATVEGAQLGTYRFDKYLKEKSPKSLDALAVIEPERRSQAAAGEGMRAGEIWAAAVCLARDLVNEPANVLFPEELARRAGDLKKLGVAVEVLDVAAMKKLGMNALLGVGQGSTHDSRLVIMRWNGGKKGGDPVAFIGKGVCFDSGGISIKPASGMEDMKGDMAGAACVVGLLQALAQRKARVNAVGAIGVVENMPDGKAQRPGDIVTTMSGQTIEIINTDAEGRLVLADVLHYVNTRFKPKFMVDLATLTGAIIVALGHEHAGLFANDDKLAERLLKAGTATGERLWRMPLGSDYDKKIDSKFADMKNTGGRDGGSITAAQLLQRFVDKTPWAHLDIAGTAMGSPQTDINKSWASGFGVRLLDRLVADHYER
jgi:leucyl aminopeptidase